MSNNTTSAVGLLSKGEIEAWCVVYGVEGALTVLGNAVAIIVFITTSSLHKRTYYLLISLAVADFLVGILPVPMFIYVLGAYFNLWANKTNISEAQTIIEVCVSYASIYSLTAIAVERMLAVLFPWKHSLESKISYVSAIIITWLFATLTASLIIFYRLSHNGLSKGIFLTIMVLLTLCLLITLVCYILISSKLLQYRDVLSSLPGREGRETKLAITFLIVSIIFIITWLPFQVVNFIAVFQPKHFVSMSYRYVLVTKFLHYFNSLVNPFIYAFRIPEFKRGLKKLFCCSANEPDVDKGNNGPWHVKGIDGPQRSKNPDNIHAVSMTTI